MKCSWCGHKFPESLGRYGCPNCYANGLDMKKPKRPEYVWVFDPNRRVYPKPPKPGFYVMGGPIYREHWVKRKVVGETRVSWLLEFGEKVQKKNPQSHYCMSDAELELRVWANDHEHRIVEKLRRANRLVLAEVARLVEYEVPPP